MVCYKFILFIIENVNDKKFTLKNLEYKKEILTFE